MHELTADENEHEFHVFTYMKVRCVFGVYVRQNRAEGPLKLLEWKVEGNSKGQFAYIKYDNSLIPNQVTSDPFARNSLASVEFTNNILSFN